MHICTSPDVHEIILHFSLGNDRSKSKFDSNLTLPLCLLLYFLCVSSGLHIGVQLVKVIVIHLCVDFVGISLDPMVVGGFCRWKLSSGNSIY